MITLQSKPCPRCDGAGHVTGVQCKRCKGTGVVPGTVRRMVRVPGEPRPLVVELREDGVYIREKGRRTVYGPLNYGGLLLAGARLYVEAKQQEKKGRRLRKQDERRKRVRRGRV